MLPLKLTMTAFGPYPEEQSIDFTELGKNPLFLINGPTGSGKTTILDGICYALYGETTGNEREGRDMRCDYADAKRLTEIELIFALAGETYRVLRIPEQQRPKSRGDGFTTQKAAAKIWRIERQSGAEHQDLLASQKITDVNQEVIQLTGLSAQQFRQVMVLPQGKFRELLIAPSEEREKIFRQLFQTHIYTRLQDKLREQAKQLSQEVETQNHQITARLDSLQMESINQLSENISLQKQIIQTKQSEQLSTEKVWNKAYQDLNDGVLLDKFFAEFNQAKRHLDKLRLHQAVIEEQQQSLKQAEAAQQIEAIYQEQQRQQQNQQQTEQQFTLQTQQCQQAEQQLQKSKAQKQAAEQQAESLDSIKQQLNHLNSYRQRSKDLHLALAALEQSKKALKQAQKRTQKAEKQYQQQRQIGQKIEHDRQQLHEDIAPLAESLLQLQKLQQQQQGLQKYQQLEQQQSTSQKKLQKAQTALQHAEMELSEQKRQQQSYQQLWQNAQASLLARQLELDSPCPVCGSLEHPHPAQSETAIATETELKHIEQQLERLNQQREKAKTRVDQLHNELNSYQQRLQELAKEQDVTIDAKQLMQSDNELKAKISWMEEQKALLPSQEQLAQCQQLEAESLAALQSGQKQLNQMQTQFSVCENQVNSCRAELPEQYQDSQKLEKDIKSSQQEIDNIEKQLNQANTHYQNGEKQLIGAQAQLELQHKQLQEQSNNTQQAQQKWKDAIQSSPFPSADEFLAACLKVEQYEQLQNDIKRYYEQVLIAQTTLQEKQQQINHQSAPDLEYLKYQEKNAKQAKEQAAHAFHQVTMQLKVLRQHFESIQSIEKAKAKVEEDYKLLGYLADISNGKNGHNLSLQRFVLSVLLDDVLLEAGHRLNQMSKGRYRLLRKENVGDRRTKSGLELEVEDAYTGKLRPVATLSGGESFMAALSLALGLSDVVQAYAGGIRLDTLFIDEGFGSLDTESLDLAINTLIDLQKNGRMVGIISHVPELKERIDIRIDISFVGKGSQSKIHY